MSSLGTWRTLTTQAGSLSLILSFSPRVQHNIQNERFAASKSAYLKQAATGREKTAHRQLRPSNLKRPNSLANNQIRVYLNKMRLGLEKKVVLVTGGTKGIGRDLMRAFLAEGAIVHFCSRTAADVETAAAKLAKDYPNATAHGTAVDISNESQLKDWITSTAEAHAGMVDVLVANVSALATFDTAEHWRKAFDTDLLGLHTMVAAATPYLEASAAAKRHPNLISISSVSGRDIDFTAPSPYGPIKAAMIHYTASLARKFAPKGIRANTVSPGNIYIEDGVWGDIERGMPDLFESQHGKNPMGRMGKPEEIADVVVFVASERASFMSGSNVTVDGALCNGVQF